MGTQTGRLTRVLRRAAALSLVSALSAPCPALAERPFDFSDLEAFSLDMPFTVTGITQTGSGYNRSQLYSLSDGFDGVVRKLILMSEQKKRLGGFYVMTVSKQLDGSYQVILALNNEHHYANITPDGEGTAFTLQLTPVSYTLGTYGVAIYGFHMPDGGTVPCTVFTDE